MKNYNRIHWETVSYAVDKPNRNEDENVDIYVFDDGLIYAEVIPAEIIHGGPKNGWTCNVRQSGHAVGYASRYFATLNQAKADAHKNIQRLAMALEFFK